MVFVTLVQGVIRPFDEHLGPLDEGSGQKTGKGADHDFLDKCGVHSYFSSSEGATRSNVTGSLRQSAAFGMRFADFSAMPNPVPSQPLAAEAEQMARLLELELIQKRALWKQTKERKKSRRALAFLFLFLLFAVCLLGFFFAFNRMSEERQNRPTATLHR